MYKVDNIFNFFVSNLKGIYEKNEAISFAYISIEKILGYNKSECIINSEKLLTDVSRNKLTSIVSELKNTNRFSIFYKKLIFLICVIMLMKMYLSLDQRQKN